MSVYRQVYTTFWTDPEVLDWGPDEKYFYLYLLTNPKTTQCGIYQISKKVIALETGYPIDRVSILLAYFIDRDKIAFSEATNELALKNWLKYNPDTSPKIKSCVDKQLAQVKNTLLIGYVRGIEGVSVKIREDNNKEKDNYNTTDPKPIAPAKAAASVDLVPSQPDPDKELYQSIQQAFLAKNGNKFTNYPKEAQGTKGIIAKCKARNPADPAGMAQAMIEKLWQLKSGSDKFYSSQPFLPSTLNASGIWDRVLEQYRDHSEQEEKAKGLVSSFYRREE